MTAGPANARRANENHLHSGDARLRLRGVWRTANKMPRSSESIRAKLESAKQASAKRAPEPAMAPAAAGRPPTYSSETLFGAARQAVIEHRGQQYVLRLTASGKLILTK